MNQIRREREKKRAQLQKDLDKEITDLRKRIKQAIDAHIEQLSVDRRPRTTFVSFLQ